MQWIESNSQVSRNSRVFTQIGKAALERPVIPESILLPLTLREESKCCFCAFRRDIHPDMKVGWWQHDLAKELQLFYYGLKHGRRPKVVIMAPPQHGKTLLVTDFVAWLAGKRPDLKTIFATYSDELGGHVNRHLQRIMTSERYLAIFGHRLSDSSAVIDSLRWVRNSTVLEYVGHLGSFRNTTVAGQITGMGLDCGIVDDPIKGRGEASSKAVLNNVWSWFTDDFFTRFSDLAGLLMIMTRWHVDDPVGRFIERFPAATILRYPAIAEEDEKNRFKDEPLFPQHKSLPFLMERRAVMTRAGWESEYQQNPIVIGGAMFPVEKLRTLPVLDRSKIMASVRSWDKAGSVTTEAAFTAGVLMHRMKDNTYVIEHIERGQWGVLDREERIKFITQMDARNCPNYTVVLEQEPGSGGKESAELTVRNLAGYRVIADRVTGSKEIRAEPFAAQVQAGNVALCAGSWHDQFIDEAISFPNGKYKDQIDACSASRIRSPAVRCFADVSAFRRLDRSDRERRACARPGLDRSVGSFGTRRRPAAAAVRPERRRRDGAGGCAGAWISQWQPDADAATRPKAQHRKVVNGISQDDGVRGRKSTRRATSPALRSGSAERRPAS